ncbi:MAG: hypothetical protein ACK4OM_04845 [Alphaproteobacteria bacterium]
MAKNNLLDIQKDLNLPHILPLKLNINHKLSPIAIADFVELVIKEGIEGIAEKTIDKGLDKLINKVDYISDSLEIFLVSSVEAIIKNLPFNSAINIVAHRIIHLVVEQFKPLIKESIEKMEINLKDQIIGDVTEIKEQLESFFIEYIQDELYDVPNYMLGKLKYYEEKLCNKLGNFRSLEGDKTLETNEGFLGYLNLSGMLNYMFE